MSDPPSKRWLADDTNFLASLSDLDRGLAGGDESDGDYPEPDAPSPPPGQSSPAVLPGAPLSAAVPHPGGRAPARPINAARALDPARVLDTSPPRPRSAPAPALPPLAFARPSPAEPRPHRPLLDLFPPSLLVQETPSPLAPDAPPPLGAAVGPRLPPRPRHAPRPEPDAPPPLTYETFYGLREPPFSLSTDPRFHYQSASHERAGQELLAAIRQRGGPAVLTGAHGMGKTTLCRSIVRELDRRTVTSLVLEPLQSLDDLLKTMLVDFGVVSRADLAGAAHLTRDVLTNTLGSFLDSLVRLQASAVVLIDEAQNVPTSVLSELAAMLAAGGPAGSLLQVVLVGQPALAKRLKQRELRGLDAGIARRTVLAALGADEISGYVMHRLSIAGAPGRIEFDDDAIAGLFELSHGSPRTVNLLCERAMMRGQAASAGVIDGALIEAAAADLDLDAPQGDRRGLPGSLLIAAVFVLLFLAGAWAAIYVSGDAVNRTLLQWQNIPLPPGGPVRRLPVPIAPIPPADL